MDLRAYYIQAAEAAAPAVHAEDEEDDDVVELTPKAVLLMEQLEVQAVTTADVAAASRKGSSGLSPLLGLGNAEGAGSGGGHDLTCPECGKTFLSDKAMYGHLRSHPERGYKGATRPSATAIPAAAVAGDKKPTRKVPRKEAAELPAVNMPTVADAAVVGEKKQREEDELWTKWPVTAKRGRGASSAPSAGSAPPVAPVQSWSEEEEAAMILLEMDSRGRGTRTETQHSLHPVVHTRDAKNQTPDVEEPHVLLDHDAAQHHQMPELLPQLMPPDHHVARAVMAAQQQTPEPRQQIVQPELAPEVVIPESQAPPECAELTEQLETPTPTKAAVVVVRDKQISAPGSQQPAAATPAGGGAKRRKTKRRVPVSEQTTAGTVASPEAASNAMPPARRIPSPASDKKHECLTCGKSFPTHQALGGHMAGHNRHGVLLDDPAVVRAMQNILAHRRKSSDAVVVVGGIGADEGAVAGNGRDGAVTGVGKVGAVTVAGHETDVVAVEGQEERRHDVQPQPAPPMEQSAAPYLCPECSMTFRSGQTLGGHKRKHWFPEKKQARAALVGPAPRGFDLNELPSDAEGESRP